MSKSKNFNFMKGCLVGILLGAGLVATYVGIYGPHSSCIRMDLYTGGTWSEHSWLWRSWTEYHPKEKYTIWAEQNIVGKYSNYPELVGSRTQRWGHEEIADGFLCNVVKLIFEQNLPEPQKVKMLKDYHQELAEIYATKNRGRAIHKLGEEWLAKLKNKELIKEAPPKKFSGEWNIYYEDGKIKTKACYQNGMLCGPSEKWYPNGQKEFIRYYSLGKPTAEWIDWHPNGQKKMVRYFVFGKAFGFITEWYENGQQRTHVELDDDGQIIGTVKVLHDNGNLAIEYNMESGKMTGDIKVYNKDGSLKKVTPSSELKPGQTIPGTEDF